MTEDQVKQAIALAVPSDRSADRHVIAEAYMKKAVLKMGRVKGASWTHTDVTFTLTSGQSEYHLGEDILSDYPDAKNLQALWRTDTQDSPIPILTPAEFSRYARGSTTTGSPKIATLHSDDEKLEVYPIPDSAYPLWGYIRKNIQNFEDVPAEYHDVLIDYAVVSMKAAFDPNVAVGLATAGLKEATQDSLREWTGTTIPLMRHLGKTGSSTKADSSNLVAD